MVLGGQIDAVARAAVGEEGVVPRWIRRLGEGDLPLRAADGSSRKLFLTADE